MACGRRFVVSPAKARRYDFGSELVVVGVTLLAWGGAGCRAAGQGGASGAAAPSVVETATHVFKTAASAEEAADASGLGPCTAEVAGRTVVTPEALHVCGIHTSPFEPNETAPQWIEVRKEETFFDDAVTGQWVGWMLVTKKDGEYVDFVTVNLEGLGGGRLNVVCDSDRSSRLQAARRTSNEWSEECGYVASKLGLGRFMIRRSGESPEFRFVSSAGPALDLAMTPLERRASAP